MVVARSSRATPAWLVSSSRIVSHGLPRSTTLVGVGPVWGVHVAIVSRSAVAYGTRLMLHLRSTFPGAAARWHQLCRLPLRAADQRPAGRAVLNRRRRRVPQDSRLCVFIGRQRKVVGSQHSGGRRRPSAHPPYHPAPMISCQSSYHLTLRPRTPSSVTPRVPPIGQRKHPSALAPNPHLSSSIVVQQAAIKVSHSFRPRLAHTLGHSHGYNGVSFPGRSARPSGGSVGCTSLAGVGCGSRATPPATTKVTVL